MYFSLGLFISLESVMVYVIHLFIDKIKVIEVEISSVLQISYGVTINVVPHVV